MAAKDRAASQWVIQKGNVYWRSAFTPEDTAQALAQLLDVECMPQPEATVEMAQREAVFTKCNETSVFSYEDCVKFVLSYAKPGDCIVWEGVPMVVMEPASC